MKYFPFYEKSFFVPALFISAVIHGLLIGGSGWISSTPFASVVQAPSSLEVTVIAQPVVSVLEEEIVSQEIIDNNSSDESVFGSQLQETDQRNNISLPEASKESRGAITKAQPIAYMNPAPSYPRIARERGWEGTVKLEALVGKDGLPESVDIQTSSGHDVLDKAALKTVKEWKFSPARSGTMRFSSRITIPIQFTLTKK